MPPAKKSRARTTAAPSAKKSSPAGTKSAKIEDKPAPTTNSSLRAVSAARRRELSRAMSRAEKAVEEATRALRTLGQEPAVGSRGDYRNLTKAFQALQRETRKTNRTATKQLEALAGATPSSSRTSRSPRSGAARASGASRSGRSRA